MSMSFPQEMAVDVLGMVSLVVMKPLELIWWMLLEITTQDP
jgi:hypothetical protein